MSCDKVSEVLTYTNYPWNWAH